MTTASVGGRTFWSNSAEFANWLSEFVNRHKYGEELASAITDALEYYDGRTLYQEGKEGIIAILKDYKVPKSAATGAVLFGELKDLHEATRQQSPPRYAVFLVFCTFGGLGHFYLFCRVSGTKQVNTTKRYVTYTCL